MNDTRRDPQPEPEPPTHRVPPEERPNLDGRAFTTEPGKPDVYIPGHFWWKLTFVIFSLLLTALGAWMIYDPLIRLVAGEIGEGRVVRLVRTQPGVEDQVIRYRKPIEEEMYTVIYQHYVAVKNKEGAGETIMRVGVDSAKQPYANVNDVIKVVYFPGDEVAFGLWHHRTWAFGAGYLSVGLILSMLAINTLIMVGRPIEIDPESPEALEAEEEELRKEREREKSPDQPDSPDDRQSASEHEKQMEEEHERFREKRK
jgi:hypothetical protein